jgi:aspartate aminotransferase-like enzyme
LLALSDRARAAIESTTSTSYSCDLKKWLQVMEAYENGGFAYHATMPTDALSTVRDIMLETEAYGFDAVRREQYDLGRQVRQLLSRHGFKSVAAEGYEAPGVVVSFTTDSEIQSGKKFIAAGLQTAAGVPLQCDESADFRSFRIGLFGLDKLHHPGRTLRLLENALAVVG